MKSSRTPLTLLQVITKQCLEEEDEEKGGGGCGIFGASRCGVEMVVDRMSRVEFNAMNRILLYLPRAFLHVPTPTVRPLN